MAKGGAGGGSMFASLRYVNYRTWFAAALISNLGTWIQRIAQDWLVLRELTDNSGFDAGLITALQFVPFLFLTPWAGLLADRLPRRQLLAVAQAGLGVLALGLGALVLSGHVRLWHVYVFAFLLGCVTAIDNPVRQTFVAELVPRESLPNAVGLNSASFNVSRLLGPALAGILVEAFGTGWAFLLNGLSFGATILGLALMRAAQLRVVESAGKGKGQIAEAVRYVKGRPDILVIMAIMAVVGCFGFNSQLTIALMATQVFDRQAGQFGLLSSFFGAGALAGALLAARRERPRVRLIVGAAFAFGLASGVSAVMPTYWTFGLSGVLVGLCTMTLMTAANSTIQLGTTPALRGRVISLYMLVFWGVTPVGSPFVGWLSGVAGARWSIGVGSLAALAVSLGAAWWVRRNWHLTARLEGFPPHVVVVDAHGDKVT